MPDEIKCPAHYLGDGVVTCDRAIKSMVSGIEFEGSEGNVLCHKWQTAAEYLWRWPRKNGVDDLVKARHIIDQMIECFEVGD